MNAVELAQAFKNGWLNFWLECDSKLVTIAFKNISIIPWQLRNRWKNCLQLTSKMIFMVSHIFRKGNDCADKLASYGISLEGFHWWNIIPMFISDDFFRNRVGLPNYRFQ